MLLTSAPIPHHDKQCQRIRQAGKSKVVSREEGGSERGTGGDKVGDLEGLVGTAFVDLQERREIYLGCEMQSESDMIILTTCSACWRKYGCVGSGLEQLR